MTSPQQAIEQIEQRAAEAAQRRSSTVPLQLATVYACHSTTEADQRLGQPGTGYVYQRDGHPNADHLAALVAAWHQAESAQVTAAGMAALSAVLLAVLQQGDHVVVSELLYGKSLVLIEQEAARLGVTSTRVDSTDLAAVAGAMRPETRLLMVETLSNPRLRVANLPDLAEVAHRHGAHLLVDNTFVTPAVCRPLDWGADFVMESLTKFMNGHGDVTLGAVATRGPLAERLRQVVTTWGLGAAPFDCWLAERGLKTLGVRADQANRTAAELAQRLAAHPAIMSIDYPGLDEHPEHALAERLFGAALADASPHTPRFGNMITWSLKGGAGEVDRFLQACPEVPFFPSLGDCVTSVSHPASTSHRGLSESERAALGISPGTLRLSVGLEPLESLWASLEKGLGTLDATG